MEKHFLADLVRDEGEAEFRPEPWYNPYGDCVVFLAANEATYADRVDEVLTLYRAQNDDRAVGFQIKGVQAIIDQFGLRGVQIGAEGEGREVVSVRMLLLVALRQAREPLTHHRLQVYDDILVQAKQHQVRVPLTTQLQRT